MRVPSSPRSLARVASGSRVLRAGASAPSSIAGRGTTRGTLRSPFQKRGSRRHRGIAARLLRSARTASPASPRPLRAQFEPDRPRESSRELSRVRRVANVGPGDQPLLDNPLTAQARISRRGGLPTCRRMASPPPAVSGIDTGRESISRHKSPLSRRGSLRERYRRRGPRAQRCGLGRS